MLENFLWILIKFCTSWCWYQSIADIAWYSSPPSNFCPLHLFPSMFFFYSSLSTNVLTSLHFLRLCLHSLSRLLSSLALLIQRHVWLGLFPAAPHNKTMMDLITPVIQTPWQPDYVFFFPPWNVHSFSVPVYLSVCFASTTLLYAGQENMLTCNPSVLLIKMLAVMGVAPGTGQQGPVSAGLSWGMANGCHGLVRALHDCFGSAEIQMAHTLGDSVA